MKSFVTLLLFSLFIVSCGNDTKKENEKDPSTETTTYYLIRHAEKNRNSAAPDDPELMDKGKQRAERWASYFEDIELDAIYATNYRRTQQTAAPTAKQQGLSVRSYDPTNLYDSAFQKETNGSTVLIVGHSNTTPAFVNAIIGEKKYSDIDDSENAMLYKVTLTEDGFDVDVSKIE